MKTAEIYKEILEKFKAEINAGNNPFYAAAQCSYHTGKPYGGINSFHLALVAKQKGFTCNEWITFKQAKEHKGMVNKGEKSTPVLFFMPATVLTYGLDKKKWVSRSAAEEEAAKLEKKGHTVKQDDTFVLKYYSVFNIEQTTLRDKYEYKKKLTAPSALKLAIQENVTLTEDDGLFCEYDESLDVITGAFSKHFAYPSFFKASIEATKHKDRCDRTLEFKEEEMVKLIGASMLGYATSCEVVLDDAIIETLFEAIDKHPYALWKYARLADEAYQWIADKVSAIGGKRAA